MSAAKKQASMPWHVPDRASRQSWATPWALFREIERRYSRGGFTLDAAAEPWNAQCNRFFTEEDDALSRDWGSPDPWAKSRVFVNPPYDDIEPWVRKALAEVNRGNAEVVVMLLPNRRGQRWFHEIVKPHAAQIVDIVGRVNFTPPPTLGPRPPSGAFEDSMIVVFELPLVAAEFR